MIDEERLREMGLLFQDILFLYCVSCRKYLKGADERCPKE